jgi:phosphoglycerol transferase MdoB-like AlkP superfamily enzyme
MYFTLSTQLKKLGYAVNGYHANDYTYYDRQISHPNLGLNWVGVGNGYVPEYSESGKQLWPQSDLRLVENTFDLYADEDTPFYTYYLTVSGHVMYNFTGNAMAARHEDLVEDLDYTETTKAYIACQYELELALTELNERLAESGLADNTLIVLTADHIPYDNTEVIDELAGTTLDETFDRYKNSLIIWSASMEESITVTKPCSSLDVLPTVSNLLGLSYDSRMLVGQDILSDSEGLVIFNDRSFLTEKCRYNSSTGEVTSENGNTVSDTYVNNLITQVSNKFSMAQSICDYDYYKYVDEYISSKEN